MNEEKYYYEELEVENSEISTIINEVLEELAEKRRTIELVDKEINYLINYELQKAPMTKQEFKKRIKNIYIFLEN